MGTTPLWLLASLAFAFATSLVGGSPLKVMSSPNLLRVGTPENIFVECQDCTGGNIDVEINVLNHPTKTRRLATTSVTLTGGNNFQALGQIRIQVEDFSKDPNVKQYVYLQAWFPDFLLEKVVLVSFHHGYIFIQTDKPLYIPNTKVRYRVFALTPHMEPMEWDAEGRTDSSIRIDIVTPEGLNVSLAQVSLRSGMYSGYYQLPEIVSTGLWKLVAKFHHNPEMRSSAEFEVKEYVLPSFEVKLTPSSFFIYEDSQELTVNIRAMYLFGEEVQGTASVLFGLEHDGQKKSFPDSLQRETIVNGNGEVKLKREAITETFNDINDLVGSSIYVAVSVLTESGGEMVEAELRGIRIITSPYTINFKRTPTFYKPGMTFDVAIEVLNPDGTPAKGVEVVVTPDAVRDLTAASGIAKLTINTVAGDTSLSITAKTNDPRIRGARQASASMTAYPYKTRTNSYIRIDVATAELELGDNLKITLNLNRQSNEDTDITYLIMSGGQLIKHGRYRTRGQVQIYLTVPITKEMVPSLRIIAYYHQNDNEVVSDSVWVDVKDSCMGSPKLESSRPALSYEPGKRFGLKVTGAPKATVGLLAVDKGIYVLNKHRLTQKKVWDLVEKGDIGCTPGGGRDSMSVFSDAGLLFESSTASGTPYRRELTCGAPSRKKRTTVMDVTTSLLSLYKDPIKRECCLDGMRDTDLQYTCEWRSEYISGCPACVEAFLHCCKKIETQRARRDDGEGDDDSYMDSYQITSHAMFAESWLWSLIELPACPPHLPNCDSTSLMKYVPLPDSITTWQLTAISVSRTHGICVGEPLEVIVRKEFFIDLRLPSFAVRGEQLEVKAILHNYSPDHITVRLDLTEAADVCSVASNHARYRQEVRVGAQTSQSVPFVIIPMKHGEFDIEVKAAVKDTFLYYGIKKILRVVPEGVLVRSLKVLTLDPTNNGEGGKEEIIINSAIPEKDVAPNTPRSTQIYVTGRENVGLLVENAISVKSMGTLISQPSGFGEQNMIHYTLLVIATIYLDKTNQWENEGFQKRDEALQRIRTGYLDLLRYRRKDGSFAACTHHKASTWLMAYVAKALTMATTLVGVQTDVICSAVNFLIVNAQQPDGEFRERGMIGGVRGSGSHVSMTAFCLIAIQESRTLCIDSLNRLPGSIEKAVAYLVKRLPFLTNPYDVAMTSYALANEGKLDRDTLFKFVSPAAGRQFTLEATAYALLALVEAKAFEEARPVVRWFNQHQLVGGGFGSTQATVIVYQALAKYWVKDEEPEYDLNVDILLPGKTKAQKRNFNKNNIFVTETFTISDLNRNVTVTARGTGEATVMMVSLYYALPTEKQSECQKFTMSVQLIPEYMNEDEKIYQLRIAVLYKDKDRDATMSILAIGLLTGFTVDTNDLNLLVKGRAPTVAKYEMDTLLSKRGSLIIYLDKVSHTRPEEITFRVHQKLRVGVLQPAAVSVYEYYDQTQCVKFYHPVRDAGQLLTLCRNEECTCAEGVFSENCSMQKKGNISNAQRTAKPCETTLTSRIDFVYKVRLEEFTEELSTDIYTMQIQEVIKAGSYDVAPRGKQRPFLSYPHCRASLNLVKGQMYLIMGASNDIHLNHRIQSFQYVLGVSTWIEYWPTKAECQNEEHRPTCVGLKEMVQQYAQFGCWL